MLQHQGGQSRNSHASHSDPSRDRANATFAEGEGLRRRRAVVQNDNLDQPDGGTVAAAGVRAEQAAGDADRAGDAGVRRNGDDGDVVQADGDFQALGDAGAAQGQSWFDIKLLIKLGFLLAVLGQSSTTSHIAVMVSMAVLVYCAQVGILRYLLDSLRAMGQPQGQQVANDANVNPGPDGDNQVPQAVSYTHLTLPTICSV